MPLAQPKKQAEQAAAAAAEPAAAQGDETEHGVAEDVDMEKF
jgi:hypothetical protein